ncbi:perilipin-2 isoform X1 [Callorhinchus milii]|uniref:Perilipin n=1 Tax=Callorhinchus milii TaxID=7868 RepID=A0A4W3HHJ0_CALMI|nr:perilipin-2 isoform X1 [Callorhinchus milii]|eukprot:gi/632950560/ref/XP_007890789.1/ PREDICTED: perilipin-2 isoform X1 [Callorhinchus milii]
MGSKAAEMQQSVVGRVANLPLVSTAYNMVISVYCNTKENHPYLKSVCEVAEKGVTVITAVAVTSAMPIIQKLEPQITFANDYACKGLDRIEETLPILLQPTDKVVADVKVMVNIKVIGAKDAVTHTVSGAKESVASTITGVFDRTKETVHGSVKMTKAMVNGSVNTVLGSSVAKMFSNGMDSALSTSEALLDHYLPLTDDEQAKEVKDIEGFDIGTPKPSCFVRLGSLSVKVPQRAYQQALAKIRNAKQRSQEAVSQLHSTVDLIENAKENLGTANQKIYNTQEVLYQKWCEWRRYLVENDQSQTAEQIESRTLAIAWNLSQQLQATCLTLKSSIQDLPQNIQVQVQNINILARDVYATFKSPASFKELTEQILTTSKEQLTKMKETLDGVMDYLVNNTALNWLVGPFYPQLGESQHPEQGEEQTKSTEGQTKSTEEEMKATEREPEAMERKTEAVEGETKSTEVEAEATEGDTDATKEENEIHQS